MYMKLIACAYTHTMYVQGLRKYFPALRTSFEALHRTLAVSSTVSLRHQEMVTLHGISMYFPYTATPASTSAIRNFKAVAPDARAKR